jgi:hypothetical protein
LVDDLPECETPRVGRPRVDWQVAFVYYVMLTPWEPGMLGRLDLYRRCALVDAHVGRHVRRSYANVGRRFGVSRQAVSKHARSNGWREGTRELDRRAYESAVGRR